MGDLMPTASQKLLARSLEDEYDNDEPDPEPHFFDAIGPNLDCKPEDIMEKGEEKGEIVLDPQMEPNASLYDAINYPEKHGGYKKLCFGTNPLPMDPTIDIF